MTESADVRLDWTVSSLEPALEVLLLMATEPSSVGLLAEAAQAPTPLVEEALRSLVDYYETAERGFWLRNVAGGWQFSSRPEHYELISRWVKEGQQNRLSDPALETLAVIAYLQPVSRSRISAIRGVNVDSVVRTLLARELITEDGLDEKTGASTLRTTDYFLTRLGLNSLDDLPELAPYLPEAGELEAELSALVEVKPQEGS